MTTIEVTPFDLNEIVRVLRIKACEDYERARLLLEGCWVFPTNDTNPNRALAQAFFKQARDLKALAEKLEDQI